MSIKIYEELLQGSDEWFAVRCGTITASEMKNIISPKKQYFDGKDERAYVYEMAQQRYTKFVDPTGFVSDDMMRGTMEEIEAKKYYRKYHGKGRDVGFITNDKFGFIIGYSPDWLVGNDGQMEAKSRKPHLQMKVSLEQKIPTEHIIQVQTGLLVSERKWCDYVSYCGGMHMFTIRVYPDEDLMQAIAECADVCNDRINEVVKQYGELVENSGKTFIATERVDYDMEIEANG